MRITILCIFLFSGLFFTCKKNPAPDPTTDSPTADVTPPVITLKGKINDTVSLGSVYTDPGATATDDVDGDISAFIVVSGSVSTGTVGSYSKEYIVRDAAGNVSPKKVRNVLVKNDADYLKGNYNAVCGCTIDIMDDPPPTSTITTSNYTLSIASSGTANNSVNLSKYPGSNGITISYVPVSVAVSGNSLSLSHIQFIQPGTGTGTISLSKTSFTIISVENDATYPSRTTTCKVVHTKM